MITPELLDQMLEVLQRRNVMSAQIESDPSGHDKLSVTLAPAFPDEVRTPFEGLDRGVAEPPIAGGWKTQAQDPMDPDPLGIGNLDALPELDPDEETEL